MWSPGFQGWDRGGVVCVCVCVCAFFCLLCVCVFVFFLFCFLFFIVFFVPPPHLFCSKSQMAPNEKVTYHGKLWLRSKAQCKSHVVDRESPAFEENVKERGSIDEHFTLCGSA
jgi:hypothetical protein